MDIKEIKTWPIEVVQKGQGLESIFNWQEELVQGYVDIENLPPFPVDLSIGDNQYLIGDFNSRTIEELSEAYDEYVAMMNIVNSNGDKKKLTQLVVNFNEELADCIHFMVESMIYSGVTISIVRTFYIQLVEEERMPEPLYHENDLLLTAVEFGKYCNHQQGYSKRLAAYPIEIPEELESFKAGRKLHPAILRMLKEQLWDFTHWLKKSKRCLKQKRWKQTQSESDLDRHSIQLMEAWLYFMRVLTFTGLDEQSIVELYYKKNQINLHRQKTKY